MKTLYGEQALSFARECLKAGMNQDELWKAFRNYDDHEWTTEARSILPVLTPRGYRQSLTGGRMVGYPNKLERAVFAALRNARQNGYEILHPLEEAVELMDLDADVELLVNEIKPRPTIEMVAAMVLKFQYRRLCK